MRNKSPGAAFTALLWASGRALVPALVAAWLFVSLASERRTHGDERRGSATAAEARLCGEWHRGAGETSPLDLGAVKKAYGALRDQVARAIDRAKGEVASPLDRPYDAGFPACRGEDVRTEAIPSGKGARLRGRTFYFALAGDPARFTLPPEVAADPSAQIILLRVRSLEDLPAISRAAGRPVSLAGADFAKVLGVRCVNTWLRVSENGDAIELHETR